MRSDFHGIVLSLFSIIISVFFMRISYGNEVAIFVTISGVIIAAVVSRIALKSEHASKEDDDTEEKIRSDNNKKDGSNGNTQINSNQNNVLIESREKTEKALCLTSIPAAFDLIGREKEIQEINGMLLNSSVIFICGEAGVGKTAIAVSLINEEKKKILLRESNYEHVAWIISSNNIKKDFFMLNIPYKNISNNGIDETTQQIANWLQIHPSFIVIDQIDRPLERDEIVFLNTLSGETKIIITTRVHNQMFSTIHLGNLDKDSCLTLFYKYYLNCAEDLSHSRIMEREDLIYADNIIKSVLYNTLLIELIGKMAYSENWRLDILWEKLKNDVFGQDSRYAIKTAHGDDGSLRTHIQKLYETSKLSYNQKEIMSFIALFPAEHSIFFDVFKWAGFLDDTVDDLGELQKLGWIERNDKGFHIHPMVKGSIEQQYGEKVFDECRYKNLIKELSNIRQYIPSNIDYTIKRERIIVPETISKLLSYNGSINLDTSILYNGLANVYSELGSYEEALKYCGKALAIQEKVLGVEHPETAKTYSDMATVYSELGSYEEALKYCRKALAIQKKVLGVEHPETAKTYSNTAAVCRELGNYEEALKYYEKALAIQEKVLGVEHPETARTYSNTAAVYSELGSYEEALEYNGKALAISERVLGPEHPDTATTYSNMAGMYSDQGDYGKALEYYGKAQTIRERVLGREHPDTAATYNNMALVYSAQGDYGKALEYYGKAQTIRERVLGTYHPDTATTYNNMASVYSEQGDYEKALEYYGKALTISERVLGPEHPSTATTYNNIARVYYDQGDYKTALKYFEKALEVRKMKLGINHPNTQYTMKLIDMVKAHL